MIAWRAGDAAAARSLLSRALAINPAFHPSHPATARAALDSLAADGARR
jgi:Tfp pilus assembly protein PilF